MSIISTARTAVTGAFAAARISADDLPIDGYDDQDPDVVASRLRGLSQRELRLVGEYERRHAGRDVICDRVAQLTGDEPWEGYDASSMGAISAVLSTADAPTTAAVRDYERLHRDRAGVHEHVDLRVAVLARRGIDCPSAVSRRRPGA